MKLDRYEKVARLLGGRRVDHGLPQEFYSDPAVYEFDLEAVFYRHWIQAGLESEIPVPGDYLTLTIGRSSVVILRNQDAGLSAFFNTCRHRGAQICSETHGHARRLVCPYHQWSYDLRGKLLKASRMHDGFDAGRYSLRPVRLETVSGVIFVCLTDDAPDFAPFRAALEPMLAPYELHMARVVHTFTLIERANWKLAMENARECYHCRAGHPELTRSFSDFTAPDVPGRTPAWIADFEARCRAKGLETDAVVGPWYEVRRFPLAKGAVSYTLDGKPAVARNLGRVGNDAGVLWWGIQPNGFNHVVGDYGLFFQVLPTGPQETTVTGKWIVQQDAVEGVDYELQRLIEVWTATNDQDRALAENNQRGINSVAYEPGPYSRVSEQLMIRFVDWYCEVSQAFIAASR